MHECCKEEIFLIEKIRGFFAVLLLVLIHWCVTSRHLKKSFLECIWF